MIEPLPRHSVQGSENPNAPWLWLTTPEPLQVGQTFGLVPGRAPLPWQFVHGAGLVNRNGMATPLVASMNDSSVSVSRSLPRRGLLGRGCWAPRPNSPPNRSPMLAPPVWPAASNRSFRLNSAPSEPNPPKLPLPPPPVYTTRPEPPPANRRRVSSYSLRLASSDNTLYASDTALNRSAPSGFLSGCSAEASLR